MEIPKDKILELIREHGNADKAGEAEQQLPDQVDPERHAGLLQKFGDVADVIARVAPRRVLLASGIGEPSRPMPHVRAIPQRFSAAPRRFMDWLRD